MEQNFSQETTSRGFFSCTLPYPSLRIRSILDAVGGDVSVEAIGGEGQVLGVALHMMVTALSPPPTWPSRSGAGTGRAA